MIHPIALCNLKMIMATGMLTKVYVSLIVSYNKCLNLQKTVPNFPSGLHFAKVWIARNNQEYNLSINFSFFIFKAGFSYIISHTY